MSPFGSPKTLERRRRRAVGLLQQGLRLREVACRGPASVSSVSQWRTAGQQGGDPALAPKPGPGGPRKVTDPPCTQWLQLLLQGATASGFPNELWTLKRIAAVMQVAFGVRYHPSHVWKRLRCLGWSCQVPDPRPIQRDEPAMAHGRRAKGPAIKKSPTTWGPSRLPG